MQFPKWPTVFTFLTGALLTPWVSAAQPDPFAIDQFTVVKSVRTPGGPVQQIVIHDSFEDGILPPKGPDGVTSVYLIRDFPWPTGSEVGGKLHFSEAGAAPSSDPEGREFLTQRARLATSTEPGGSGGLRSNGQFAVSGVFDLIAPVDVGAGYGIGLTDSTGDQLGNDVLDLTVLRNQSNAVVIQLARRDWQAQQTVLFQELPIDFAQGDQIKLALLKPDSDSNAIHAFFQYVNGGNAVGTPTAFNIAPVIFRDEDFTRAEFQAVFVVPEPQSAALLVAGLAILGGVLRLRRGRTHA